MGPFFKVPNGGHFKYEVYELISQVSETLKEFGFLTFFKTFISSPPSSSATLLRLRWAAPAALAVWRQRFVGRRWWLRRLLDTIIYLNSFVSLLLMLLFLPEP